MFTSAILLAAGESRRMGRMKLLQPLGAKTILEQALDNLLCSLVDEVIVVVGYQAEEVIGRIAQRSAKIAFNPRYRQGIGTSIVAGLPLVERQAQAIMITLADKPLIESCIIDELIENFAQHDKGIVIPVFGGRRGHPVIFSIKYLEELMTLKGDVGAREIVNRHPGDVLEVPVESEGVILDINTLKDLQRLRERLTKGGLCQ